jgi:parvulin-like peptidyl-prolyl isomerase
MMQGLRENMKLIIWITAIGFLVGFGILQLGGVFDDSQRTGPAGVIAKINGEAIHYEQFQQIYTSMVRQVSSSRELQPGEDSYVREQAWQQLLRSKLMEQEVRRRKISTTPEEIKASIRLAPPEFILQAPAFQTDGQFDYRKFLAELDNPNSQMPWREVEQFVANALPSQKLQEQIVAAARVSEGDVRDRFLLQNEVLTVRYLAFPPDSFPVDTTQIGGADIETYYKAHPEEFTGPDEVRLQVLIVPRAPGEPDFAAAKERIQAWRDQLVALPDSFESYARTYSEIQSAPRGGGPAEAYLDDLRPAIRTGLRPVPAGQVSPVIREERSLHLFRVDKRYRDEKTGRERIVYHEIAIRVIPGPEALQATRNEIASVIEATRKDGMSAVATKRGYRTFESDYFSLGNSGNSVFQQFPEVELWCFQNKVGAVSRSVPSEQGWFVFQILDHRKAGLRPLEPITAEVKARLIHSRRMAKAEQAAGEARAAVVAGMGEAEAAARHHGHLGQAGQVTRNGILEGLGRDPRTVGALFTLPALTWSPVQSGEAAAYFAYIEKHTTPSEEDFQRQEATVRQQLLYERRQTIFFEWMENLRRRAKIEDYRDRYFEA